MHTCNWLEWFAHLAGVVCGGGLHRLRFYGAGNHLDPEQEVSMATPPIYMKNLIMCVLALLSDMVWPQLVQHHL